MYKRNITFTALSLVLIAATPAMVVANISNGEHKRISSKGKEANSKSYDLVSQSDSKKDKTLTPAATKQLLEQLRIKSRVQAAQASFNLSVIAGRSKDFTLALNLIEEAIQLDNSNPKYLTFASDISFLTQNFNKAEEYQMELLQIVKSTRGSNDLQVAKAQDQLGAIYFAQEHYEEAKSSLQESLQLREKVLGEKHLQLVVSLNKLATLAIRQQHSTVAEELLKRSIYIVREVSGSRHANSAAMLANLADLYLSESRLEEAEVLYEEAISIWADSPGDPLRQATGQYSLGRLLLRQQRFDDARSQFKRALLLLKKNYSNDHPYVQQVIKNITAIDAKRRTM